MNKRDFKDRLYEQFARIGRALASSHRLELLDLLAQGERSVEELAAEAELTVANASQHLRSLHAAQLVATRKEGTRVLYRLASPEVYALWQSLRSAAESRLGEIDRVTAEFLTQRDQMEAVGPEELLRRLADDTVILLDVRPEIEYRQGHIAGAISLPVDQLVDRIEEFPTDRTIVAYCRGPYCVFADEAVAILERNGFRAARLTYGYPDWAAARLPVANGTRQANGGNERSGT